ncbi:hypothetical protein DPMN_032413 [Dreissena polymorpha]|uniref:Uncharacterized protein n=1 Tax=Dreissena polymorpha TaxID=45954 RepID=A0A9D4RK81_DREPO|nr:hypothetical protein DPMN_032413 [Dreissena polymorpha]
MAGNCTKLVPTFVSKIVNKDGVLEHSPGHQIMLPRVRKDLINFEICIHEPTIQKVLSDGDIVGVMYRLMWKVVHGLGIPHNAYRVT